MAATDPLARYKTLSYTGGTVTAPAGVLNAMFPGQVPSWFPGDNQGTAGKKYPFGTRQRNQRRAGEDLSVRLTDGSVWIVRVTGTHKAFLQKLLGVGNSDGVTQVWSERGTIYGPVYGTI